MGSTGALGEQLEVCPVLASIILTVAVLSLLLAAAYGFLNQPAPPQPVLREATIVNAEEATFFDVGLDDASIPFDDGITAARKCGFCMG